jgi:hypothetical protein
LFSSLQNSEGGGDVLNPANYLHFRKPKLNFSPSLHFTEKVSGFLAAAEALLKCYELTYLFNVLPEYV